MGKPDILFHATLRRIIPKGAMPKPRSYKVDTTKKHTRFVGTIKMRDVEAKVRKPLPPPSQRHTSKKTYRRKPKHPTRTEE